MAPAAERLGDRAVRQVGADRHHRLDPDDQDQQRGHQRSAADAGQADQDADAEAEQDHQWVHRHNERTEEDRTCTTRTPFP